MIVYDVKATDLVNGYTINTLVAEDQNGDEDLHDWEKVDKYLYDNFGLREGDIHYFFEAGEVGNKDKVVADDFEYEILGIHCKDKE